MLLAGGVLLHGGRQQLRLGLRLLEEQLLLGWRQRQLGEIRTAVGRGRSRWAPNAGQLLSGK